MPRIPVLIEEEPKKIFSKNQNNECNEYSRANHLPWPTCIHGASMDGHAWASRLRGCKGKCSPWILQTLVIIQFFVTIYWYFVKILSVTFSSRRRTPRPFDRLTVPPIARPSDRLMSPSIIRPNCIIWQAHPTLFSADLATIIHRAEAMGGGGGWGESPSPKISKKSWVGKIESN